MSDIGSVMGAVSPIVSLIPGVGQIAGPAIGALGSLLSVAGEKQEQQKKIISASPGRYGTGGPVTPNWQTVGHIKFDSNKARQGKHGNLIVTDVNSGRDYGVVRKSNGSYEF